MGGGTQWKVILALAFGVLVQAALLATAAVLLFRPAVILGVTGKSLDYSVTEEAGGSTLFVTACSRRADQSWECTASDAQGSGEATWRVRVKDHGCWEGERVSPNSELEVPQPRRESACLGPFDYLRFWDRILGE